MFDESFLQDTLLQTFENNEYYNIPKGIVRFDYGNSHGWFVRVTRDRAMFRKMFSDGAYGSIHEALKQAILYRHEILRTFPVTIKQVHFKTLPVEAENRIKRHEDKGKSQPYIYWRARWYNKDHDIESENFSVLKYGEDGARALALEAAKIRHNKQPKLSKIPDPYQQNDLTPILRADVEVLSSISSTPKQSNSTIEINKENINYDPFAFEGERKLELHKSIERDRNLRNQKLSLFLEENQKLFCELCHFNFLETYPFLKSDIIEVHHIIPLSTLSEGTRVTINDLMLLCSNCHFAIHQGDAEENMLIAMDYFDSINMNSDDIHG